MRDYLHQMVIKTFFLEGRQYFDGFKIEIFVGLSVFNLPNFDKNTFYDYVSLRAVNM